MVLHHLWSTSCKSPKEFSKAAKEEELGRSPGTTLATMSLRLWAALWQISYSLSFQIVILAHFFLVFNTAHKQASWYFGFWSEDDRCPELDKATVKFGVFEAEHQKYDFTGNRSSSWEHISN